MLKKIIQLTMALAFSIQVLQAQMPNKPLIVTLNDSGTNYIKMGILNQSWLRFNQNNPETLVNGQKQDESVDFGLRRTRLTLFGQISPRATFFFQVGQNNFNRFSNYSGNRKNVMFIHDAVGELKLSKSNELKLGTGLTIANGLSRFSQPSIGTIATTDVPVFAQTTVDQTDQFSRKLSVYARGQVSHLDYRIILSDPFPISSNGLPVPAISSDASFSPISNKKQIQGLFIWQFFNHEQHLTPYMNGTYLGTKKIFNISGGFIYQAKAMWNKASNGDTIQSDLKLFCIESFLDMPLYPKTKKLNTINAYLGYFNLNYGNNYLRYNGIMNNASSSSVTNTQKIGTGGMQGNAFPMFGTGQLLHSQVAYFTNIHNKRLIPRLGFYGSASYARFQRLGNEPMILFETGVQALLQENQSKVSLNFQNRPTFTTTGLPTISQGPRRTSIVLQYQMSI
jgi:hypothetical protein